MDDQAVGFQKALRLASGKVPPGVLQQIIDTPRCACAGIVVPPAIGEDGAVVSLPAGLVVVATDPITFRTSRPGYYAVCVNANDIAVMGARPRFYTLTGLFPPGVLSGEVVATMRDVMQTADRWAIGLIGGHTEVTDAVSRLVLSLTMFGELISERPLCTGGARAGDAVIQVHPLAVEGTSILADEHAESLAGVLDADSLRQARGLFESPGISVVDAALAIAADSAVHALHDPTEGGLATGLREMATAAGLGLSIQEDRLLRLDVTERICDYLGYDAMGLISSGCLLVAAASSDADRLVSILRHSGHEAARIGVFTEGREYTLVGIDGQTVPLPEFAVDELARQ